MSYPARPSNPYTSPSPKPGYGAGGHHPAGQNPYQRPTVITVLSILNFIAAPFTVLLAIGSLYLGQTERELSAILTGLGIFYLVMGVMSFFIAIGLWRLKGYGRTLQIVSCSVGLLAIPIGTLISALILYYFLKPGVKILFSETPRSQLTEWDVVEIQKLQYSSSGVLITLAIIVPLIFMMIAGVFVVMTLPSIESAGSTANEASAIGDLHKLRSGEIAYAKVNGGHYDTPECLAAPADCIPGYSRDDGTFLMSAIPETRHGYRREFLKGQPASTSDITFGHLSPTSLKGFAFIAYPETSGETGSRGFCTDATGRVCITIDGSKPVVVNGRCDPGCTLFDR